MTTPITVFDDRELNTILHALAILQEVRGELISAKSFPVRVLTECMQEEANRIARIGDAQATTCQTPCDHFDEVEPLTNPEIDALCDRLQLRPEPANALDSHARQTIKECAEATRTHLGAIHKSTTKEQHKGDIGDVIEGMQITMSKLEYLLEREGHPVQPCGHVPSVPNAEQTTCELCGGTISPNPATGLWRAKGEKR